MTAEQNAKRRKIRKELQAILSCVRIENGFSHFPKVQSRKGDMNAEPLVLEIALPPNDGDEVAGIVRSNSFFWRFVRKHSVFVYGEKRGKGWRMTVEFPPNI